MNRTAPPDSKPLIAPATYFPLQKQSVEGWTFILLCLAASPIWALAAHAAFGQRPLGRLPRLVLAVSIASLFLNRKFGGTLGPGAFDDVPQYVYLFQHGLSFSFVSSLKVWSFEPGFILLTRLLSYATDSNLIYVFTIFFASSVFLVEGVTAIGGRLGSLALLCFFSLFGVVFYGYMHLMRQTLSFALFVYGVALLLREQANFGGAIVCFIIASTLHIAALPFTVGVLLTRALWTRSRWLLGAAVLVAIPAALMGVNLAISLLSGFSGRLQAYYQGGVDQEFPTAQFLLATTFSLWLIYRAIRLPERRAQSSLFFTIGLLGVLVSTAALFKLLPIALVSRQLMVVVGLLSILAVCALKEIHFGRWSRLMLTALLLARFASQQFAGAPHLAAFSDSGALQPWAGAIYNMISGFGKRDSEVPGRFGEGAT